MHGAGSVGAGGELQPRMSVSPDPASRGGLASGNRDTPSCRVDRERIETLPEDRKGSQPLSDSGKPALNAPLDTLFGASVGSDAESHLTVAGGETLGVPSDATYTIPPLLGGECTLPMKNGLILGSALAEVPNSRSLGLRTPPEGVFSLTLPSGVRDSHSDGPVGSLHHAPLSTPRF